MIRSMLFEESPLTFEEPFLIPAVLGKAPAIWMGRLMV